MKGIINFYGNDNGSFSAVAGPGHFNDPDMVIMSYTVKPVLRGHLWGKDKMTL